MIHVHIVWTLLGSWNRKMIHISCNYIKVYLQYMIKYKKNICFSNLLRMIFFCFIPFWLGIGILSRYPIVTASRKVVPYQQGPDTNRRVIIHAKVRTDNSGILDVFVVHFSYVRKQQCENADILLKLLRGTCL